MFLQGLMRIFIYLDWEILKNPCREELIPKQGVAANFLLQIIVVSCIFFHMFDRSMLTLASRGTSALWLFY